jgi:hypothetical protein
MDARKNLKELGDAIPTEIWQQLLRDIPDVDVDVDDEREKKVRHRELAVEAKGYENVRLIIELPSKMAKSTLFPLEYHAILLNRACSQALFTLIFRDSHFLNPFFWKNFWMVSV